MPGSRRFIPCRLGILTLVFLVFAIPRQALSQNLKLITGTVTELPDGNPVPGANVKVKGASRGAVTDANGKYTIQAASGDVLSFSFIGLQSKDVAVGDNTTINVSLEKSESLLKEVVVNVGYGTVRKEDLTGSVGIVSMKDLEKAPVPTFVDALAGRIAGVQVASNDGQPGTTPDIIIRGAGSLTQDTSPLYVIDGFPLENALPGSINPDDIAAMTILKDASATAIYGSRGANGVVVIETKKGKAGKPVIALNSSVGFQDIRKKMDVMGPYEFVKYQLDVFPADAALNYISNGKTLDSYINMPGIDWTDQLTQLGNVNSHSLSLRGGSAQTRYAVSTSLYDQKAVLINTGFKRYQGRLSLDHEVNKKVKVGLNANYSNFQAYGHQASSTPSNISSAIWFRTWAYRPVAGNPVNPLDPDPQAPVDLLNEAYDADVNYSGDIRFNPRLVQENSFQPNTYNDLNTNAYLDYSIIKGLVLRVTGNLKGTRREQEFFYNQLHPQGNKANANNSLGVNGSIRNYDTNIWSNENTLTYTRNIANAHSISALGGFSLQKQRTKSYGYSGTLVPEDVLGINGIDDGTTTSPVSTSSENSRQSVFGRVLYNYKSRYYFTGTYRADGSSKFAEKWAYFPSAGVSWAIHNESFMKNIPVISTSKIRATYGLTGNDRIGDFAWYSSLDINPLGGYSFNNQIPQPSANTNSVENRDLKWEVTRATDFGFDLGLVKNRIELTVDWYKKITSDLLLQADLPRTTGFTSAQKNIGKLSNTGWEFSLNTMNIKSANFTWASSFNISFNKNKILELTRGQTILRTAVSFDSGNFPQLYMSQVGQPAGMMFGYIWDGVYQYEDFDSPSPGYYVLKNSVPSNGRARTAIQPGEVKYRDLNGDGAVTVLDLTVIGRGQPIHIGGFSNNFTYKRFSLNAFFQWSYGNNVYNANRLSLEGNSNLRPDMNQFASYINRWSPENQTNDNYKSGGHGQFGYHSSRMVEDGSYIRLKTVSLAYSIPQRYTRKIGVNSLAINASAQNLFTLTKYSGMDPEVSTRSSTSGVLSPGFDYSPFPQTQTMVLGVKAEF